MFRNAAEQTIISVSGKVTAAGSVTAVGSGITGQAVQITSPEIAAQAMQWADFGMFCGIAIGLAGFAVQSVSSYRRDKREKKMHDAQMAELLRRRE